jgi:DNA-binding response OmpR family regulator
MYHVLIADDDVDAWFQVNALLRRYLIKASFVTNLSAARQYAEQQSPSLLFIGNQLQGHSVLGFIKYIRSKHPEVKIIMTNTYGEGSMGFRSGADLVISKPLIPEIIERGIIQLLFPKLQEMQQAWYL